MSARGLFKLARLVPSRNAAITFILVTAVLDLMSMGIVMPVLPALIQQFSGSSANAGIWNGVLAALWAAMQFLCSPIIGALSDQVGRRPVILISAAGLALDWMLMALAPNLWWLAVGRIIGGITSSSFASAAAYIADITEPEKRARAYGLLAAAFNGGGIAGPVLGGLLGAISPRAPFWAAAALSGVAVVYGMFVLPESLPPENRKTFTWRSANPFGALSLLKSHHELLGLASVNFLANFAYYIFTSVFVLYTAYRYGWSARDVGLLLSLAAVFDVIVLVWLIEPIVKRLGERRTLLLGLLSCMVGLACMGLASSGWLFILAMVPNGLCTLAPPMIQALMTKRVSSSEQGLLQGANASLASIAGVASPLFFGMIYALSVGTKAVLPHPGAAFFMAAVVLLASTVIGQKVTRESVTQAYDPA